MSNFYYTHCKSCHPDIIQNKLERAQAKRNNTNGFQGCSNYGKNCDYEGLYGTSYCSASAACRATMFPERLCDKCELKQFPKRYHSCYLCRKTIRYSLIYKFCNTGFDEWSFNLFYNKNSKSNSYIFVIPTNDEINNCELWQVFAWE